MTIIYAILCIAALLAIGAVCNMIGEKITKNV